MKSPTSSQSQTTVPYFVPRFMVTADNESSEFATKDDPYAVGAVSSGEGDFGGKSYGTYQFPSSVDTNDGLLAFISWNKNPFRAQLQSAGQVATAGFDAVWKQLAADNNKEFGLAQEQFAVEVMWKDLLKNFDAVAGITVFKREDKLIDLVVGTVNQYGTISKSMAQYVRDNGADNLSTNQIGLLIQNYKLANVESIFKHSSQSVRDGVRARILRERKQFE